MVDPFKQLIDMLGGGPKRKAKDWARHKVCNDKCSCHIVPDDENYDRVCIFDMTCPRLDVMASARFTKKSPVSDKLLEMMADSGRFDKMPPVLAPPVDMEDIPTTIDKQIIEDALDTVHADEYIDAVCRGYLYDMRWLIDSALASEECDMDILQGETNEVAKAFINGWIRALRIISMALYKKGLMQIDYQDDIKRLK